MRYRTVRGPTWQAVEREVRRLMRRGWRPQGGVITEMRSPDRVAQAMVKGDA